MKFELGVSGLNCFVTETDLIKMFNDYAKISNVLIKRYKTTNLNMGNASVFVNSQEDVDRCITGVDKTFHFGYRVNVCNLGTITYASKHKTAKLNYL